MSAISNANPKLKRLRHRVNFFPSSFDSMGAVTIPTITKVVINAAIEVMPAPPCKSEPLKGTAMK